MLEIARILYLRLVDDGVRFVDRELFGGRIEELDRLKTSIKRLDEAGYGLVKLSHPVGDIQAFIPLLTLLETEEM